MSIKLSAIGPPFPHTAKLKTDCIADATASDSAQGATIGSYNTLTSHTYNTNIGASAPELPDSKPDIRTSPSIHAIAKVSLQIHARG